MRLRKRKRFTSLLLVLVMLMSLFPFSAFAETEIDGSEAVTEIVSAEGENSGEETPEVSPGDESDIEDTTTAGGEGGEPIGSYIVSIRLPEEGVALAEGQDEALLTQTISAGNAMTDIRLVSTYEDEPLDSDMADIFNERLFDGTGLTASFGENGVITVSGTPTQNVTVDLADAFAEDAPAMVDEDTSAIYVSSSGNDSTGNGSQKNPYATISKAYTEVADGGKIYLLSDLTESDAITFSTDKTITITSADTSDIKTIYSEVSFGYEDRWFLNVSKGHVKFNDITIDGENQKNKNGNYYAPGAVIASSATVTIDYGTTIQNFKKNAGNGGGAAVVKSADANAVVNIKDGVTIKDCVLETGSADDPAAVLSSGTGAIMYMTGGTVTGNTLSTSQTSTTAIVNIGMYNNPHFWMTGGTITGNTINNGCAAVYMRGEATACDIEFGDTAYVYDNYVNGTSGDQRNIYLKNKADDETENSNIYVKLCSALTESAKLGVYAEKIGIGTKVAQGGGVSGVGNGSYTATAKDATYFFSDKETDAEILYCGGSADTCGLLAHRDNDTDHNNSTSAIYLSVSPTVTATKNTPDGNQIDISIARCTSDATYVVLDRDLKPVTGKTLSGSSMKENGTFSLTESAETTTIEMPGLDKDNGPYTVMLVGTGGLSVDNDGKAITTNLTDIATVNIVNFAGENVTWSDGTNTFTNGDYDIVIVPHNDQTGKANKTYTATAKRGYAFSATDPAAITGLRGSINLAVGDDFNCIKDESKERYTVKVTVPSYGTTTEGTANYNTVTLTGAAEKDAAGGISVSVKEVAAVENTVGTLDESVTVTLNITDDETYKDLEETEYKYTVTNGRDVKGDVKTTTGKDGKTTYTIEGLKYGDHVKVYVEGAETEATYFKVLSTSLENGGFENATLTTETKNGKTYTGNADLKTGETVAAWRTTASDQNIEVYSSLSTAYGVTVSPNDGNVGELNATEASSLYQEISTTPSETLGWTMYHAARSNAGENTQRMAIVIGPALDAGNSDPYKKTEADTKDMFMSIAAQIENPVMGETYYTTYDGKKYQVTIASDTKSGWSWKNYMGTYTVPDGQTETVFAFASLDTSGNNAKMGNLIDGVNFETDVPITAVTAEKTTGGDDTIDISIENSTQNGVYVVLDKDMKPVTDKAPTGGSYVAGGNGTFNLNNSDASTGTTIKMQGLDKSNGPYTVMRVMSGTLSVDSTTGVADTTNLVDIATVNIVNFKGDGVTWKDNSGGTGKPVTFEDGDFDIVTVPHGDQTGEANKTYTAKAATGYAFAGGDAITGKLDNERDLEMKAPSFTATKASDEKEYTVTAIVPKYGDTGRGGNLTGYNTVTLTGTTVLDTGVKLLDESSGRKMTETDNVASKVYDGAAVAYTGGSVDGATLTYTWQKKNASGETPTYTDLTTAPSDAGDYNLKITAMSSSDSSKELGTENLPFTITPKKLTVTATAKDKTYDGGKTAELDSASLTGIVDGDSNGVTLENSEITVAFTDKNAGDSKAVTATVADDALTGDKAGNYKIETATAENAKISPKTITAAITATSKTYDGSTNADVTPTLDGVVNGDSVTATASNAAFANKNAGNEIKVTANVALSGDDVANYKLENSTASATADITAKELSVTVTAENKAYDGKNDAKVTVALNTTDIITGDNVALDSNSMSATFDTATVGDSKTVTVTGLKLTGTSAGNYKLPDKITGTANINQAGSGNGSVTLNGWTYGDTANTPTPSSTTNGTNNVTYQYKEKSAEGENAWSTTVPTNAGEYTVKATFPANDSYGEATATANFTISKKELTATITAENKEYDGTNNATVKKVELTGMVNSETVTATATGATFENANAEAGKKVTATITLDDSDAAKNYTVATTATTTASITAKTLTVIATAQDKVYNGETTATITTITLAGKVGTDTVSLNQTKMTAAFADANVESGKTVTVSGLTLDNNENGNYKLPETVTTRADITKADGTGTVALDDWTYGGTAENPTANSGTNPETETDKITYLYKVKGAADNTYTETVPTDAGEYTVKATFPANDNYNEATATKDFTILPKAITATVTAGDKTYDGNTTATITGGTLNDVLEKDKNNVSLVTTNVTGQFADKHVGVNKKVTLNGTCTLTGSAAGNYTLTQPTSATASITKKELSVKATAANKPYDGTTKATVTVALDTNSKVADDEVALNETEIEGEFDNANAGTGKTVTVAVTGLTLSGTDANNYSLPESITCTADITKATAGCSVTMEGWTYGSTESEPVPTVANDRAVTYLYKEKDADDNAYSTEKPTKAETYTVKATFAADNNYQEETKTCDFTIAPKLLTVTIEAEDKVYDGTVTADVDLKEAAGIKEGDNVNVLVKNGQFNEKNAGSRTVTAQISLSGEDAGNYTVNCTASTTASITAKELGVTVSANSKTYDGKTNATAAVTLEVADIVEGDAINLDSTGMTATFDSEGAGNGKTVTVTGLTLTGTDKENYKLPDSITGTANITQADNGVGEVNLTGWTYGDAGNTPTANSDTNPGTDATKITYQYKVKDADDGTYTNTVPTDAGEYTVKATFPANNNYNETTATADFIISPKAITATISAQNKIYDGSTDAAVTKTELNGVVSGDSVTATASNAKFEDKEAGNNKTVTADITLANNNASNYKLTSSTATTKADITAKELGVIVSASSKTYDGKTDATATVTLNTADIVEGDTVELNSTNMTATFGSADAGTGKTVTVTGLTLSGTDANNYSLPENITCTADITQATAGGTVSMGNWEYGSASSTPVPTEANGRTVTYLYKEKGADDSTYSTEKPTKAGTYTVKATFAAAGNYGNETAVSDFKIEKKLLTVTVNAANKEYDGTDGAEVTLSCTGLVEGDDVKVTANNARYDSKNVGARKVTATISLTGETADNYTAPLAGETTATITPKPLSLTIEAIDKQLNGSDSAELDVEGAKLTGVLAGEDVAVASAEGAFKNPNKADEKAEVEIASVQLKGTDSGNYEVTTVEPVTAALLPLEIEYKDGDNKLKTETIDEYEKVAEAYEPEKAGYNFAGWFTDEACKNAWNRDAGVTEDITVYAKWTKETLYTLSGKVTEHKETATSGATVRLCSGNEVIAETKTNSSGNYSFSNVPSGVYNITAKKENRGATESVEVKAGNTTKDIKLPSNAVAAEVEVDEKAPAATVGGMAKVLEALVGADDSGKKITVGENERLEVKLNVKDDAREDEKSDIKQLAPNKSDWDFINMDVDWTKYHADSKTSEGIIKDTVEVLAIRVPYNMSGKRDIVIYRHHVDGTTGATEVMALEPYTTEPAENAYQDGHCYIGNDYIVIYSKQFSAFGIGYTATGSSSGGYAAPTISGAVNGGTYCESVTLTVQGDNISSVTVNGEKATLTDGKLTLTPSENPQTVVAKNISGSSATITVTVKDGHSYGEWTTAEDGTTTHVCSVCGTVENKDAADDQTEPSKDQDKNTDKANGTSGNTDKNGNKADNAENDGNTKVPKTGDEEGLLLWILLMLLTGAGIFTIKRKI